MPITHIVALKFKSDLSEERIREHFEKEVNLKERMPDLIDSWFWSKNLSLESRSDCNLGCNYVISATVKDMATLTAYLEHPEHIQVKELQGPLIENKFVVDITSD